MIIADTIQDLRNKIKGNKGTKVVLSRDLAFNRAAMEQNLVDILVFPSGNKKDDRIKYLDTGLNLISARIAAKNNVVIALDIERLRGMDREVLGENLARIMQNIDQCKKAKARLAFTNARTQEGAKALLRSLGATTQQAAQAISF